MAKETVMTQGSPIKSMIRFALPILAGGLFQQMYNIVDSAIVGRFVGSFALAAIGSTASLMFFLFTVINGLCLGAGILISQCWGGKKYDTLKAMLDSFCALIIIFTLIISAIGFFLAPNALKLLKVPDEIMPLAVNYMQICIGLMFGNAIYAAASSVLRSIGNSKAGFTAMAAAAVTNTVLDLLFVAVFKAGVAGAAYATVISQFLSAAICVFALTKIKQPFNFSTIRFKIYKAETKSLLKIGLTSAMQSSLISVGGMSVQSLVNSFGAVTMAAYTTVSRIDSFTIQFVVALRQSITVFAGQNIGCGQIDRIKKGVRQMLCVMLPCCALLAVLVFFNKELLMQIFLNKETDAQSILIGCKHLSIIGFAYFIAGIMNTYLGVICGAGDINISVAAGLAELAARIVFSYSLTPFIGVVGIFIATPLAWGCGCIIPVVRYYSMAWAKKAIIKEEN